MLVKNKIVVGWMILGLCMIFFQIVIGGVTRLTGSGLSITKWEIVTGTVPPIGQKEWDEAFEMYKGTPQYQKINEGMTIKEFKFIYFWEYLHRLWARLMGFVFLIPFLFFLRKGWIQPRIVRRLVVLVFLAALVGVFGWIMVASGLVDRPWVNAYKLSIHLGLALVVFSHLLWTILMTIFPGQKDFLELRTFVKLFLWLLGIQLLLGGVMSGSKAALSYPTWPDMEGEWVPSLILNSKNWVVDNFVDYDRNPFLVSLVQFMHRSLAYILFISGLYIFINVYRYQIGRTYKSVNIMFITMLVIQIGLGISVLVWSHGSVSVLYGVLHQAGAILLLATSIILFYFHSFKPPNIGMVIKE